ncbi:MAG: hypothetical protein JWL59_2734 [Chthoniobacteraceae bacterium]|nr:hypothetical protein [Chthoniobacteraceae bacterium]
MTFKSDANPLISSHDNGFYENKTARSVLDR